jgi:hypothetical protein
MRLQLAGKQPVAKLVIVPCALSTYSWPFLSVAVLMVKLSLLFDPVCGVNFEKLKLPA